jgi:hypothetical protein
LHYKFDKCSNFGSLIGFKFEKSIFPNKMAENSPLGRNRKMYDAQDGDIEILLKDGAKRRIHSIMMKYTIGYFGAALQDSFKEGQTKSLDLSDIDEKIADNIFYYLYCGDLLPDNCMTSDNDLDFASQLAVVCDRFLLHDYRNYILSMFQHLPREDTIRALNYLSKNYSECCDKYIQALLTNIPRVIINTYNGVYCVDGTPNNSDTKYCCKHPHLSFNYTSIGGKQMTKKKACNGDNHDANCCYKKTQIFRIPKEIYISMDMFIKLLFTLGEYIKI